MERNVSSGTQEDISVSKKKGWQDTDTNPGGAEQGKTVPGRSSEEPVSEAPAESFFSASGW